MKPKTISIPVHVLTIERAEDIGIFTHAFSTAQAAAKHFTHELRAHLKEATIEVAPEDLTGLKRAILLAKQGNMEEAIEAYTEYRETVTCGTYYFYKIQHIRIPAPKPLHIVLHQHDHTCSLYPSAYLVASDTPPTKDQVIKALGIDFEPDRDETIEIQAVTPTTLPN